ncbi:MAG: transporter substrate-binding protein, partial [Nocardiaceae bacterium]|nr:transporter substrate-binding protein [Nocardiaceae bacterium]
MADTTSNSFWARNWKRMFAAPTVLALSVALASCGSKTGDSDSTTAAAPPSCVDTSGDTIKLGFLNSLTGGMAISEKTVSNVLHMAADEINASGGILGKKIEYIQEDGATDWPTFAEKTEKLITKDCVA